MAKTKSSYVCQNCSYKSPKWLGQCPNCSEWNTFEEVSEVKSTNFGKKSTSTSVVPKVLSSVSSKKSARIDSGIGEFNRVLGGGFVNGQVILLSGEPGIGKSTLLTQLSKTFGEQTGKNVCYVAGEESPEQIKLRAERLDYDPSNLYMLSESNLETILASIANFHQSNNIGLIIVDSIQTVTSDRLTGVSGSIGQVKLCASELAALAKRLSIPTVLVGHVTKDGTVAGPKVLEHLVDTVLHLEGDSQHLYRLLKTNKNRFGAVSEVGMFEMQGTGLREVANPSEIFLSQHTATDAGSCVTVVMEGHRPLLFEIQALTVKSTLAYPRRTTSGFSAARLQVLTAILEKRARINLSNHDIYVNVAGGFKVNEYACDLAVCLAIASSIKDKPLKAGTVAFGECGLMGEIRRVSNIENREKEAKKLGYSDVISPKDTQYLSQAIKKALSSK